MTNQVKVKVEEVITKIQDLTWDSLEVAEEQTETKPLPMDSLVIDWIPDLIEEVIVDWHRPRVERWYIMPGLGPEAEAMMRTLRMLEIARDAEIINTATDDSRTAVQALVDSVAGSFDTFFKACSALFEIRILCVWDEFVWKMERRKSMKDIEAASSIRANYLFRNAQRPGMTEVEWNDLRARGQFTAIQNYPSLHSEIESFSPGALALGALTEEEVMRFRAQWFRDYNPLLAFCTPSRFGLTGRQ